jgi:TRAP-type C4-dicarboxylate transport system substrate-binding protein
MVLAAATVVCVLLGGVLAESALAAQATMKIGHSMNTETFRHKSLLMFKEKVEKETEGRVAV